MFQDYRLGGPQTTYWMKALDCSVLVRWLY